jgi:hypothetical protein
MSVQDGHTLERIDVHGGSETAPAVLMHGAECYVGRNDNPSESFSLAFSAYISPLPMPPLFEHTLQLGRSCLKSRLIRFGTPWARRGAIRYACMRATPCGADGGGRTTCITSLLLCERWRQRRTTRISLLLKYASQTHALQQKSPLNDRYYRQDCTSWIMRRQAPNRRN